MLGLFLLAQLASSSPAPQTVDPPSPPAMVARGACPSARIPAALTQIPSARQMSSFYPVDAMRGRRAGRAVIRCRVPRSGLLSVCKVVTTTEPAFGAATLRLSTLFRARPATCNGVPADGVITIPVVWSAG